jgi:hypothetical protein
MPPPALTEFRRDNLQTCRDAASRSRPTHRVWSVVSQGPPRTAAGAAAAQPAGKGLAELLAPAPDRLIGGDNASFSQEQFDIPQAEAEHVIQPNGVADDLGRKAMAVNRVGRWLHAVSLVSLQFGRQIRLT